MSEGGPAALRTTLSQPYTRSLSAVLASSSWLCPLPPACRPALQRGVLPACYKISLCTEAATLGMCSFGAACSCAHSPAELRGAASIRAGLMEASYKTALCPAFVGMGACPAGKLCPTPPSAPTRAWRAISTYIRGLSGASQAWGARTPTASASCGGRPPSSWACSPHPIRPRSAGRTMSRGTAAW